MKLNGLRVLLTGASRGLGRALALHLGRLGARLVLVARDPAALQPVADTIHAHGGEAHAFAVDVADKNATHPLAARALAALGGIDVVIHNASALGPVPLRPLLDTDCEDLEAALAVNVVGPHRLTRALVGAMAVQGRGTVLFVSSDAAVEAYPTWGAYGASKAALDHYARILATELHDTGVRVLTVDPGEMNTRMHADALPDADPATLRAPEEVAARIVSLLTDDAHPTGSRLEASSLSVHP